MNKSKNTNAYEIAERAKETCYLCKNNNNNSSIDNGAYRTKDSDKFGVCPEHMRFPISFNVIWDMRLCLCC